MNCNCVAKLVAEAVGTFFLCFAGIGAILADAAGYGVGLLGIAVAHGLALAIGVTATGHISGGHLNPAVTFGFMAVGRVSVATGAAYVGAQCAGALVAALLWSHTYGDVMVRDQPGSAATRSVVDKAQLGTPAPGKRPDGKEWSGHAVFFTEAVLTFLLMTAVFGTAVDPRAAKVGGFGIGLTVTFDILAGGPISGAAMNPARVFGPALAGGFWNQHLTYWLAPASGAIAAAVLYEYLLMPAEDIPEIPASDSQDRGMTTLIVPKTPE
jgi:MIP family channel proteins